MSYGHHLVHVTDDKIVSFVKEENLSDNVSEIANNTSCDVTHLLTYYTQKSLVGTF